MREEYEVKKDTDGVSGLSGGDDDDDDEDDDEDEHDDVGGDDTDAIIDVVGGEDVVGDGSEIGEHADSDNKLDEGQGREKPSNRRSSFSIDSILSTVVTNESRKQES